jgi:hypothetical protein
VGQFLFSGGIWQVFLFNSFSSGFQIVGLLDLAASFQFAFSPLFKVWLVVACNYLAFRSVKSLWFHCYSRRNLMIMTGINWGYLIIQMLIFGIYPLLSLVALFSLRRSHVTGITQVVWALLIVAIPVLGSLAFFIVKPTENNQA